MVGNGLHSKNKAWMHGRGLPPIITPLLGPPIGKRKLGNPLRGLD